jgi:hypothetical protein
MNRRSSIYSLRVPAAFPEEVLDQLVGRMYSQGRGVLDQHSRTEDGVTYAAIGFRAENDEVAHEVARSLGLLPPYTIITGYGAHRRTV